MFKVIKSNRPGIEIWHSFNIRQKTHENVVWSPNYCARYEIGVAESNGDVKILAAVCKLGNSSFCACTVKIWPKLLVNAHRSSKYPYVRGNRGRLTQRRLRKCWICKLIIGVVIKAQNDWRDGRAAFKLQCVAIATFLVCLFFGEIRAQARILLFTYLARQRQSAAELNRRRWRCWFASLSIRGDTRRCELRQCDRHQLTRVRSSNVVVTLPPTEYPICAWN